MRASSYCLFVALFLAVSASVRAQNEIQVEGGAPLPVRAMQVKGRWAPFDTPPKFLSGRAPNRSAAQPGVAASAQIAMLIDETGRPVKFEVIESDSTYLTVHAIAALKQWRFEPARSKGRPVPCVVRVPSSYAGYKPSKA